MDDLFIKDLERRFGDSGYAFWFKTLELIGNHGERGEIRISWDNYLEKLHKRRTQVELMLDFCQTSGKFVVNYNDNFIAIECKKFAEYSDNYTKYGKQLQSDFKETTKQEEEVDKKKKKNRIEEDNKIILPIVEKWNKIAEANKLKTIIKVSPKRESGVLSRLREKEFNLDSIENEIVLSDFLRGINNTGWKVDFDFIFCSANNYLKILEGKYRNGNPAKRNSTNSTIARATFKHDEKAISRLEELKATFDERDRVRRERTRSDTK